jgi:hypothetical protein
MPTWRHFRNNAYRCGFYEAEDVLSEIDDVDLIRLEPGWAEGVSEYWLRRPLYHDRFSKLILANAGLKKVRLDKDYDLFIALLANFSDLPYINAVERWKDHCKTSVCWLDDLWTSELPNYRYWLPALRQFDYVFLGFRDTVPALSRAADRPCFWLPGGVDALRFTPLSDPAARPIDVYSIGRRHEGIHREMLNAAKRGEIFYLHDTRAGAGMMVVSDHRQHRDLFANIAKRSRYFVVAPAKMDQDNHKGQVEVGFRYFEGAAAGTVMIGETPDCEAYKELFGWPEAVIQIEHDGSDAMSVLNALDSDPGRTAAISRRNTREALLRHDWLYRWSEMLRIVGIEPSLRKELREQRLIHVADLFREGTASKVVSRTSSV